jgi:hypothetical protein
MRSEELGMRSAITGGKGFCEANTPAFYYAFVKCGHLWNWKIKK